MEWVLGLVEGLYSFVHLLTLTSSQKLEKRLTVSDVAKFESSDRLKRVAKIILLTFVWWWVSWCPNLVRGNWLNVC